MNLILECRKLKRIALIPGLLLGGIVSSAFPIVNLAARADSYIRLPGQPLAILFSGNWMMMALLNGFLAVLGACILYSIEFSNNAIERMDTLPLRPGSLIVSKFILLSLTFIAVFVLEGAALAYCGWHWFRISENFYLELMKSMAYSFLLTLPVVSFMMAVSSFCKNMWITLGIGVICIFAAQIFNQTKELRYFPFLMPFQPSIGGQVSPNGALCLVAVGETLLFLGAGIILTKVRRNAA
jgi:lantibiotic transport system permease protein